jgi:UDP-glucose 4-epimerase
MGSASMGRTKRIFDLILRLWPLYKVGIWLGKQPGIGTILSPLFSARMHQVTMIPVNEVISQENQTILPYSLLQQLVQQASARFIMTECMCRSHEGCQNHPTNLGCLFIGDGAAQIHPSMGKLCSVEEAQGHIQRGIEEGLYPLIAHTMIDAVTLGIPYTRMLTVCFCCECCCAVHNVLRNGPKSLLHVVQPLPGLRVFVDEKCVVCGNCLESCPVRAITFVQNNVEISEECKGCGICMNACPCGAIRMEIKNQVDLIINFTERIKSYADVFPV